MAQRYTGPLAHSRMTAGGCPECGKRPEQHSTSREFWTRGPGCDLLPEGVSDRIAQFEQDRAAAGVL